MKISKEMWAMGLGPTVGVLVPAVLKNYVEPQYGAYVPVVGEMIGWPWGRWSTLIPIATGAAFFLTAVFVKSKKIKIPVRYFLGTSGVTMLVTGFVNGIWNGTPLAARARAMAPVVQSHVQTTARTMGSPAAGMTPTGISGKIIYS